VTPEERTSRALTAILGLADKINQYVTSLSEQNFYRHRPTQLIAEAFLHRIGTQSHAWKPVSLRSTRQFSGKT
jgi:hypothetical protein